jgi:hypothetical protein
MLQITLCMSSLVLSATSPLIFNIFSFSAIASTPTLNSVEREDIENQGRSG